MTDPLTLKDALDIYQTQYTQVDKLWSYFCTVTVALLGFTIGSEKATKSMKEVAVILLGYLVFCYGNFAALYLGQKQLIDLNQIANTAIHKAASEGLVLQRIDSFSLCSIASYYVCVVVAVLIGVIFIAWKRQHSK